MTMTHDHDHDDHDHAHDHHHALHAPADSFVLDVPDDIDRDALIELYAKAPDSLWRSKGFVRIKGEDHLVQVAMGSVEITPTDPRDRHYLVFIGDGIEPDFFTALLENSHVLEAPTP